jgi:hypothetical protein
MFIQHRHILASLAPVAQWIEHLASDQAVRGSTPFRCVLHLTGNQGAMLTTTSRSSAVSPSDGGRKLEIINEDDTTARVAQEVLQRKPKKAKFYSPLDIKYREQADTVYHFKTTFYKLLIDLAEHLKKPAPSHRHPSVRLLLAILTTHKKDITRLNEFWKDRLPILARLHRNKDFFLPNLLLLEPHVERLALSYEENKCHEAYALYRSSELELRKHLKLLDKLKKDYGNDALAEAKIIGRLVHFPTFIKVLEGSEIAKMLTAILEKNKEYEKLYNQEIDFLQKYNIDYLAQIHRKLSDIWLKNGTNSPKLNL